MLATTRFLPIAIALTAVLQPACDEAPDSELDGVQLRDGGTGTGGVNLNTWKLFDSQINAVDTHDQTLSHVTLLDVALPDGAGGFDSIDDDSLWADHGTLRATINNLPVEGEEFEGSRWRFRVGLTLMTAHITVVETADDAGLWNPLMTSDIRKLDPQRLLYTFIFWQGPNQPVATCGPDATGGPRTVIYGDINVSPTGNVTQRPNTLYLACTTDAVGKASQWGYAPDSPSEPSVSLDFFETAIREVRADYCADGKSYTEVGNLVTMRDSQGINDFADLPFVTEAVWEEGGGATCVSRIRKTGVNLSSPLTCSDGVTQIPLCPAQATLENQFAQGIVDLWSKIEP